MIEMRWLEKTIELSIPFSLITYTDIETVLQFREMIGSKWSKWTNVPTVKE
jgi:hypothetical protein